jgi:hypothetical protein
MRIDDETSCKEHEKYTQPKAPPRPNSASKRTPLPAHSAKIHSPLVKVPSTPQPGFEPGADTVSTLKRKREQSSEDKSAHVKARSSRKEVTAASRSKRTENKSVGAILQNDQQDTQSIISKSTRTRNEQAGSNSLSRKPTQSAAGSRSKRATRKRSSKCK